MTLHPGVHRNHHSPTLERFGPDTGHDIPMAVEFTRGLQPLLDRFGTADGFHLILFTLDETVFSREIAPLAGFYPSVYVGAPWWFLDAPEAVRRLPRCGDRDRRLLPDVRLHRRHPRLPVDPRPARHVTPPRRGYLAQLVAEHRLDEDEALETARRPRHDHPDARRSSCEHDTTDRGAGLALRRREPTAGRPRRCASSTSASATSSGAHAAWYTEHAPDAAEWGIAAFTGPLARHRRAPRPRRTVSTRSSSAAAGRRHGLRSSPASARCTPPTTSPPCAATSPTPPSPSSRCTVTEAGYRRDASGWPRRRRRRRGGGHRRPRRRPGSAAPCRRHPASSSPACSPDGRPAPAGIAIVPNDNVPDNGEMVARVVGRPRRRWSTTPCPAGSTRNVSFVTTMVDRITPAHHRGRPCRGGSRRPASTTPRRCRPSRSPSGCSPATSRAGAPLGVRRCHGSSTTSDPSSSASCGCSTAPTR